MYQGDYTKHGKLLTRLTKNMKEFLICKKNYKMATISTQQSSIVIDQSTEQKQNYTPALISLAVLYFMMGLITCLNDTLVPFFKNGFNLTYAESSLVQFYFFLTYGILSVLAGKIVGRIGYKNGMVLGFAIAALGA